MNVLDFSSFSWGKNWFDLPSKTFIGSKYDTYQNIPATYELSNRN